MAYCVIADVQALNSKRTYSATSTPSLAQLQEFIDSIAGEIDTMLQGRGFSTPAVAPAEFVISLRQLNAIGSAAIAERAMFPDGQGLMGGTSAATLHWRQYQDGLKYLREGSLPSELAGSSSGPLPFSFFGQNKGNDAEPAEEYGWQRPKFGKNKDF